MVHERCLKILELSVEILRREYGVRLTAEYPSELRILPYNRSLSLLHSTPEIILIINARFILPRSRNRPRITLIITITHYTISFLHFESCTREALRENGRENPAKCEDRGSDGRRERIGRLVVYGRGDSASGEDCRNGGQRQEDWNRRRRVENELSEIDGFPFRICRVVNRLEKEKRFECCYLEDAPS